MPRMSRWAATTRFFGRSCASATLSIASARISSHSSASPRAMTQATGVSASPCSTPLKLTLRNLCAHGLPNADEVGGSDPYVRFTLLECDGGRRDLPSLPPRRSFRSPPSSAFLAVANSSLSKGFFSRTENAPAQESRLELLSKGGEEAEERPVDCASKVFALNVASTSMSMESLS